MVDRTNHINFRELVIFAVKVDGACFRQSIIKSMQIQFLCTIKKDHCLVLLIHNKLQWLCYKHTYTHNYYRLSIQEYPLQMSQDHGSYKNFVHGICY